MKTTASLFTLCLMAGSLSVFANKTPISNDTTTPNVFWFSNSEYIVDESETNLVVTVDWTCGHRGWSGWVDVFSAEGTAVAGEDYTSVSNRLYFSGPGSRSFTVPIHGDAVVEGEETVQLLLSNPSAILETSNAVVKIQDVSLLPRIAISSGGNGTILLSWPGQTSEYILESAPEANGAWSEVPTTPSLVGGSCCVTQSMSGTLGFFRLKRVTN